MLGSVHQKQSDLDYVAALTMMEALFEGSPRAFPADGTPQTIEAMELGAVEAFVRTHLGLNNLTVVIGGDMRWEEGVQWIERILEPLQPNRLEKVPFCAADPIGKTVRQTRPSDQAYVYFGAPFDVAYDGEETHLAKVAGFVLGSSGFGSRLMEEIRVKRGLAYSAYGRFALERTAHYLTGHLQTKLESESEAIALVREVVATFVRKGITAEELEGAKQFLLGSEPLRTETLSQRLGRAFNEYYAHKPLGSSLEELERIEALSPEEVNDFIRRHDEIEALTFGIVGRAERA
jgi:predicted Zn-dependent peptidase